MSVIDKMVNTVKEVFDLNRHEKVIVAVTIRGKTPMMVVSKVAKNGKINMLSPELLPTDGVKLAEVLIPKLAKYTEGIKSSVLIDDHSDLYVRAIPGAAYCPYDRPREMRRGGEKVAPIVRALSTYQTYNDRMLINLATSGGNFHLMPSMINEKFNAGGELVYEINREAIRPEHILTILTLIGTLEPTNDLHQLIEMNQANERMNAEALELARAGGSIPLSRRGEYQRGIKAVTAIDQQRAAAAEKSLAGTRISDNEWIL